MQTYNSNISFVPHWLYKNLPKHAWAAIAISLAMRLDGEDRPDVTIIQEWRALYDNQILRLQPPNKAVNNQR